MPIRRLAALLALALAPTLLPGGRAAAQGATADTARDLEPGRTYTRWFYEGKTDTLWALFSPRMRQAVPGAAQLAALREQIATQLGAEAEVVRERGARLPGVTQYTRIVRFEKTPVRLQLQWVTGPSGAVEGFLVRPYQEPAASRFLDYQTKTPLRLPFDGEWHVVWGGRTPEENYHVVAPDQRFAYDLLVTQGGASHTGDGTANEQFHCFGRPVLAPAEGTVAAAVDGIDDNVPGQMNPARPAGNHLVLDHGNGEFSLLAHFRKGTVAVKPGDRVRAGQKLGECGNSGNSSEPHLHYHLQNTGVFGQGEGLPAQFLDYVADGRPVARGEPAQGQSIRPR